MQKVIDVLAGFLLLPLLVILAAGMMFFCVSLIEYFELQTKLGACQQRNGTDCKIIAVPNKN